ncbi:DinB family protein [Jejudonia soesokkakensis]|uniref:DinB family protein n=1 Tax=Jejudonia soesokkakensis TaxID=1323432 RepID=A0ABW2MY03_9FLAO
MEDSKNLSVRFKEVLFHGTWVANTNYRAQLENLDWQTATTHIADLNSIAALTQHINYYIKGVNQVFDGGQLEIRDTYSFDFPEVTSQEQWKTILNEFWKNANDFASYIEALSEEKLATHFVDKKYGSYLRNVEGMIEHCYYHLGQIVLIKKMLQKQ